MLARVPMIMLFSYFTVAIPGVSVAQEPAESVEDPAHDELRTLRDDAVQAFKDKDIDRLLESLHPNVMITVQNGATLRGHNDVREFHKRMSVGEDRVVTSISSRFDVDQLSILYGDDTAIATGAMYDEFQLSRGMEFDLESRWTATLVKQDEKWFVAAFHISTDMFDNGVSRLMMWWRSVWVATIAVLAGAVVGGLIAWRLGRRRPQGDSEL